MNELLALHTGRSVDQIARDTERDYYMSAEEAMAYGIVDRVVSQRTTAASGETDASPKKGLGNGPAGPKASAARSSGTKKATKKSKDSKQGSSDGSNS